MEKIENGTTDVVNQDINGVNIDGNKKDKVILVSNKDYYLPNCEIVTLNPEDLEIMNNYLTMVSDSIKNRVDFKFKGKDYNIEFAGDNIVGDDDVINFDFPCNFAVGYLDTLLEILEEKYHDEMYFVVIDTDVIMASSIIETVHCDFDNEASERVYGKLLILLPFIEDNKITAMYPATI